MSTVDPVNPPLLPHQQLPPPTGLQPQHHAPPPPLALPPAAPSRYGPDPATLGLPVAPATATGAVRLGFSRYARRTGPVLAATLIWLLLLLLTGDGLLLLARNLGLTDTGFVESTGRTFARAQLTYGGRVLTETLGAIPATLALVACANGALRLVRTGRVRFLDFFHVPIGWQTAAFVGIGTAVAMVGALTFASGLVTGLLFMFAAPAFIDRPGDALAAYRTSSLMVGSRIGQVLLLWVIGAVLLVAGALVFVVGLLWAVPVAGIAVVAIYCGLRQERIAR